MFYLFYFGDFGDFLEGECREIFPALVTKYSLKVEQVEQWRKPLGDRANLCSTYQEGVEHLEHPLPPYKGAGWWPSWWARC
jgi:hypothetical protein